jgi:hypothetical protein
MNTVTQPLVKHELRTRWIYAIPIINRYMERIGLPDILSSRIGGGGIVPNTSCLMIILKNILTEREPIYGMGKWASSIDPSLLGLSEVQVDHMNDYRMGRTMEMLFDADKVSMFVEIVKNVIEKFGISMDEFHNGSTKITFSGEYEDADGSDKRGGSFQDNLRAQQGSQAGSEATSLDTDSQCGSFSSSPLHGTGREYIGHKNAH